ncbi:MAG TPA: DNA repair protein RadC [Chitinophagaceae bacterium]|nr:DNA repair protein RadC [Chitinophagaceae bacterium]
MAETTEGQGRGAPVSRGRRERGIKSWASGDRPREKMIRSGVEHLSDSELLALIIGTGCGSRSAIDLAREVLNLGNRDWQDVGQVSISKLMKIKGIGSAKAVAIRAALEIGKRSRALSADSKPMIRSSRDAAAILEPVFADQPHESFGMLFLNHAGRVNHMELISKGGISGTVVDPRILFKKALDQGAASLVLCHNHPSGSLKPSEADLILTRKLREAGKLLDINVVDHIIVSREGYFSFADQGLL